MFKFDTIVCIPPGSSGYISVIPTRQNELPAVRLELQKDLRAFIKKVGPELGEIYTTPDLKWGDLFRMQKVRTLHPTAKLREAAWHLPAWLGCR